MSRCPLFGRRTSWPRGTRRSHVEHLSTTANIEPDVSHDNGSSVSLEQHCIGEAVRVADALIVACEQTGETPVDKSGDAH